MNPDLPAELRDELLDDFFSECDEHLTRIRQNLVLLEPSIGKAEPDKTVVNDLLRSFHSFKGISAIVGLRAAEELAHAAEHYLRELTRGTITLSTHGLEQLMQATQRLEQVASAFRDDKAVPDISSLLAGIRHLSGTRADASAPAAPAVRPPGPAPSTDAARARGLVLWKFTFAPSRELDERGVNINAVRTRLSEAGEILQSTPSVRGEGQLSFEFVVGMKETPADIASWESDGIRAELLEQLEQLEQPSEPVPSEPAASDDHNPFIAPSHVVRVALPRLDDLVRIVGEMVIKRSRFDEELNRLGRKGEALDLAILREVNAGFGRSLRELREGIMHVRMVPVAEIFARMPFVVRDLARESHKTARLVMEGQQTELDKYLIEKLKDPLLHLVRNSFSHGVETAEDRRRLGKSEEAIIQLSAAATGDSVVITVNDDGRGIDQGAVLKRAAELGMPLPSLIDNAALLEILCRPGFSTRTDADRAAGRGVGLEVVHRTVQELCGTLALETEPGRGARFIIRVPLTLAIADTIIVSAASQTCAVPQNFVSEVLPLNGADIRTVNGVEVIPYREGVLPVVLLRSFFRLAEGAASGWCVLVLRSDRGSTGLVVDKIHGQREVVVRAIRDPLIRTPGIAGATELGDGRPVLILDGAAFTNGAVRPNAQPGTLAKN